MHPFLFAAQSIQNRTDGIGNTAEEQQKESWQRQNIQGLPPEGDHCPTHADVADHGEDTISLVVNGSKGGGDGG